MEELVFLLFYMPAVIVLLLVYILLHEAIHYLVAVGLGCQASIKLFSDGLLPSMGVQITNCSCNKRMKTMILYSPYTINILMIIIGLIEKESILGLEMLAIGCITFLNVAFEDEEHRKTVSLLLPRKITP